MLRNNIRKERDCTGLNSSGLSVPGLPLCSLGIMKDAWDRLRQCISPTTSMSHYGNNTLPILNQVFHFICGSLIHLSSPSPTLPGGQTCSQADPKAIAFAILQQQQRAEVIRFFSFTQYHKQTVNYYCRGIRCAVTLAVISSFIGFNMFVVVLHLINEMAEVTSHIGQNIGGNAWNPATKYTHKGIL